MGAGRIFAVDGDDLIRTLLKRVFERDGYEVETLQTGEECVARVREETPDLVTLEAELPGIDGLNVCRILKGDARTSKVPIMMLASKTDEADVVIGLEVGADDYVGKPVGMKELLARAHAILHRDCQKG